MKHKVKHVHFVGIGGAGMSGIAEVLATQGFVVSGSDLADGAATRRLAGLGVKITIGHSAANIIGANAVVVSTAVAPDNPEVVAARECGTPVVPRAGLRGPAGLAGPSRWRRTKAGGSPASARIARRSGGDPDK